MTAEPLRSAFVADPCHVLATARSCWLDAFAGLEIAVLKFAKRHGAKHLSRGTSFKQRLSELASTQPSSTLSKEKSAKLQAIVHECQTLLPLRASIVHSTMQIGRKAESEAAFFQNALDAADGIPCYVVMTEADFTQSRRELIRLRQQYDAL